MKKQIINSFIYSIVLTTATALPFTVASCNNKYSIEQMSVEENNNNQNMDTANTIKFIVKNVEFRMVTVEGGFFLMGSGDGNANNDQRPVHKVTLSGFSIGQTEVTQELWHAVMNRNPSDFSGKNLPVDNVTWNECRTFITRLNKVLHDNGQLATDKAFHLPTEAQWEFAARGGNKSKGYKYAGGNDINAVAWTRGNTNRTHPVASKIPNELGIYDMSGNVWEWVEDYYAPYSSADHTNPVNTSDKSSSLVIKRGGSWYYSQEERFTPSFRYGYYTDVTDSSIGMRLCLS
jgi:formylglycine-generating enzyme required for sulfatase activity